MNIFLLLFTCVDDVKFTHTGSRQQSFSICMSEERFKLVMEFDLKLLYYMSFFKVTSAIFFNSSFCQIKSDSIFHLAILWSEISEEFKTLVSNMFCLCFCLIIKSVQYIVEISHIEKSKQTNFCSYKSTKRTIRLK